MSNELPSLPAGFRWHTRHKRAWVFADMQRKTWYGWKTIRTYDYYDVTRECFYLGLAWA